MINKILEKVSQDIWFNLRDTTRAKIRYGEETITDYILLEILRSENKDISVIQTPKITEKEKGTDWEWWIGTEKLGWLRYAIQAKKLDSKSLNYKSLNYKTGKRPFQKRQIDVLKRYAEKNNAIPLYCFYNYVSVDNNDDLMSYWHQDIREYQIEQFGWTCSPLENVLNILDANVRGNKNFHNIHNEKETFPIRYLTDFSKIKSLLQDCKKEESNIIGYSESLPSFFKDTELLIDRDKEEEYKKGKHSKSEISYYKKAPDDSIFNLPNYYNNNVVINNVSIISRDHYDEETGLYPKRIVKIDIKD